MHLAQINVARACYDLNDARMTDFVGNLDRINALAEATPGFVWRLQSAAGNAIDIRASADPRLIANLTVWESVQALFDYVYRSDHRSVMVRRREWFEKPNGPYQALWWAAPGTLPTLEEGLARLHHLVEHGPTAHAFTFKTVFPAPGTSPTDLKPEPFCVGWA